MSNKTSAISFDNIPGESSIVDIETNNICEKSGQVCQIDQWVTSLGVV